VRINPRAKKSKAKPMNMNHQNPIESRKRGIALQPNHQLPNVERSREALKSQVDRHTAIRSKNRYLLALSYSLGTSTTGSVNDGATLRVRRKNNLFLN
jgi:hypothetical protein